MIKTLELVGIRSLARRVDLISFAARAYRVLRGLAVFYSVTFASLQNKKGKRSLLPLRIIFS